MCLRYVSNLVAALLAAMSVSGCGNGGVADAVVVSVGDATLTRAQLMSALPATVSAVDSAVLADEFIRKWTYRQVLLRKASQYLGDETAEIEDIVAEYRASLIIETYQNKLVGQKFNSDVSASEVQGYYDKMKQNFVLSDAIVKGCWAILPAHAPGIKDFLKTLSKFDEQSSLSVEEYLFRNAQKYKSSFDSWISLSEIRCFFPADFLPDNVKSLTRSMPVVKTVKDGKLMLLKVTQAIPAGEVAPVEFVRGDIASIIVGKRKLDFLNEANKDIYNNALRTGEIKFYDKND